MMAESISFKAYLKQDGRDVEVRRFAVEGTSISNFLNLRERVKKIFPVLQNDNFVIFWQDSDDDYITIGSDEELMEALVYYTTLPPPQPFKLYIQSQAAPEQPKPTTGGKVTHGGVVCDSCDGPVAGFRYKCVVCPDFDLCANCEAASHHSDHLMVRIPQPISQFGHGHPKFFRKFMGRPHKMHKRHCREEREAGLGPAGPSRCPFGRRDAPPPSEPFDFTVLTDFINELGVGTTGHRQTTTGAQTSSQTAADASTGTQNPGASAGTQTAEPPRPPPPGAAYLNGIGQAIAAFLDPFDLPGEKKNKIMKKMMKKKLFKRGPLGPLAVYHLKTNHLNGLKMKLGHLKKHPHFHVGMGHGPMHCHEMGHGPKNGNRMGHGPKHSHGMGHGPKHGHGMGHGHVMGHGQGILHHGATKHGHFMTHRGPHGHGLGHRLGHRIGHGFGPRGPGLMGLHGPRHHCGKVFENNIGVDVSFDVRGTQEATQPAATQPAATPPPARSPANPTSQASAPPTVPTPTPQSTPVPTPAETPRRETSPPAEQVDDWTLVNRESPTRGEASAMEVDENQGVRRKTGPLYPELPKETPTAPPHTETPSTAPPQTETLSSDAERKRIKDNIEKIRAMGFDVESWVVQEILRRENFDLTTVLEKILSMSGETQPNK